MSAQASLFDLTVLPLFEEYRGDWLADARAIARELGRGGKEVTVNDVRRRLPPPDHIDPRVMGAIFRGSDWVVVRHERSERSTCHNRPIAVFRLRDADRRNA